MQTRTGNFPIGFRRGGIEWQKDLPALAKWAKAEGFEVLDLPQASPEDVATLKSAGLRIGSADLLDWPALLSFDAGKRKEAIAKNSAYIEKLSAAGCKRYFVVVIPEEKEKPRLENYKLAVESYGELGRVAERAGSVIVLEGWPGGGNLPNLCCNPETYRAIFKDTGTKGLGVNYDPSHLIRMGIDHVRFAREFAPRIQHVHAKDTEVMDEAVYEFGRYQPGLFSKSHRWGEHIWRYTLPGHGCARWTVIFQVLAEAGFQGAVCVELEDENFNGSEAGEKNALQASLAFLKAV